MSGTIHRLAPRPETDEAPSQQVGRVIRMTERAVYSVREVADMLALSLGGTYQLCRNGDVPALKLGGRWVIPKKRFHVWLDNLPTADPEDD